MKQRIEVNCPAIIVASAVSYFFVGWLLTGLKLLRELGAIRVARDGNGCVYELPAIDSAATGAACRKATIRWRHDDAPP